MRTLMLDQSWLTWAFDLYDVCYSLFLAYADGPWGLIRSSYFLFFFFFFVLCCFLAMNISEPSWFILYASTHSLFKSKSISFLSLLSSMLPWVSPHLFWLPTWIWDLGLSISSVACISFSFEQGLGRDLITRYLHILIVFIPFPIRVKLIWNLLRFFRWRPGAWKVRKQ